MSLREIGEIQRDVQRTVPYNTFADLLHSAGEQVPPSIGGSCYMSALKVHALLGEAGYSATLHTRVGAFDGSHMVAFVKSGESEYLVDPSMLLRAPIDATELLRGTRAYCGGPTYHDAANAPLLVRRHRLMRNILELSLHVASSGSRLDEYICRTPLDTIPDAPWHPALERIPGPPTLQMLLPDETKSTLRMLPGGTLTHMNTASRDIDSDGTRSFALAMRKITRVLDLSRSQIHEIFAQACAIRADTASRSVSRGGKQKDPVRSL